MFRGDARNTGFVEGRLADKLEVVWRVQLGEAISATAAIDGDGVYVGCEDGVFHALDFDTGRERWTFKTDDVPIKSSALVHDGLVMFGDDDGILHALEAESGAQRWSFKSAGKIISSPVIVGDRVLVGSYDAFLYCLNVEDGAVVWKYETAGYVHGTPGVTGEFALAAGCDELMHVVSVADGKKVREISLDAASGTSAAIVGDRVFVGTYGNQVLGVDWAKGEILWRFENKDRAFPFMGSAAVTDEAVYIGGRDKLMHAFDPGTGKEFWSHRTRGRIDSSPVVVGDRIYFGADDGVVYGLKRSDGEEVWRFEAGGGISASPAVADGRMVIGTMDGALYCFGHQRAD